MLIWGTVKKWFHYYFAIPMLQIIAYIIHVWDRIAYLHSSQPLLTGLSMSKQEDVVVLIACRCSSINFSTHGLMEVVFSKLIKIVVCIDRENCSSDQDNEMCREFLFTRRMVKNMAENELFQFK